MTATPAPAALPLPSGLSTGPVAGPTPAELQQQEKARLVRDARAREFVRKPDLADAEERMLAWGLVRVIDPADAEAIQGYERARRDAEAARQRQQADSLGRAAAAQQALLRAHLARGRAAYEVGQLDAAERAADEVLATRSDDPQALSLRAAVGQRRRAGELRRLLLALAGTLGAGAAGLAHLARRGAGTSGGKPERRQVALLKVVDGVGRGRLVRMEGPLVRIGAAESGAPDQRNDLVLSDSERTISRFHCSVIGRGREFFLLDASLNGTSLNGVPLGRGDQRRLRDGDEFVLAEAARIRFLLT